MLEFKNCEVKGVSEQNINPQYLEQCMAKYLLVDKDYVVTISTIFEKHYFDSPELQEIFVIVRDHFNQHHDIPEIPIIVNTVPADKRERVERYLGELDTIALDLARNRPWILEQTDVYLKDKAIKDAIRKAVDIIDENENIHSIRSLVETALCKTINIDLGLNYFDQLGPRLTRMFTDETQRLKTYFPTLDDYINGGFPPKTLSVLVARIHGFKCVCADTKVGVSLANTKKTIRIEDLYKYICNDEIILQIGDTMKQKGTKKIDLFINKYGEEEGTKRHNEWLEKNRENGKRSKGKNTLQYCIERYGEEEGTKRYNEKSQKLRDRNKGINTLQYYVEKYGEVEGNKKYIEKNNKLSEKGRGTLQYFIDRYGLEDGSARYKQYIDRQKRSHSLEGYIEKYGEAVGVAEWSKFMEHIKHTTSLQGFISRHGEKTGKQKWEDRQTKWQATLKAKSPEEIERINRAKINTRGFSFVSQELFWSIATQLESLEEIFFAQLDENKLCDKSGRNHEYMILTDERRMFFPDFFVKDKRKIIEFDGDYWHGGVGNKTKDNEREQMLVSLGYKVLRIKQADWSANPNVVILKCMEFING